jgi:hypothetical protein
MVRLNENEMGGTFGTQGEERNACGFLTGKPEENKLF